MMKNKKSRAVLTVATAIAGVVAVVAHASAGAGNLP